MTKRPLSIRRTVKFAVAAWAGVFASSVCEAGEKYDLSAALETKSPCKVTAQLEVGGEVEVKDPASKKIPMSVKAKAVYLEQRLGEPKTAGLAAQTLRKYSTCQATLTVEKKSLTPTLLPTHQWIAANLLTEGQVAYACLDGPLTRDELDLLEQHASTIVLDQLLPPAGDIEIGQAWQPNDQTVCQLLCLDAVSVNQCQAKLAGVAKGIAEIDIAGTVQGAVDGVATEIDWKAKLHFVLAEHRISACQLVVKEVRAIGFVGPGLDVTAKLTMKIEPAANSGPEAKDETFAAAVEKLPPTMAPEWLLLEHTDADGQFKFVYPRDWHIITNEKRRLSMRLLQRGELIAQCNVGVFPTSDKSQVPNLGKFQTDIQKALGNGFTQFQNASEGFTSKQHLVYHVVAQGVVSELPIQWNYHLISDGKGRNVVFAFTIESKLLEPFGSADEALIRTVEFPEQNASTASRSNAASR